MDVIYIWRRMKLDCEDFLRLEVLEDGELTTTHRKGFFALNLLQESACVVAWIIFTGMEGETTMTLSSGFIGVHTPYWWGFHWVSRLHFIKCSVLLCSSYQLMSMKDLSIFLYLLSFLSSKPWSLIQLFLVDWHYLRSLVEMCVNLLSWFHITCYTRT